MEDRAQETIYAINWAKALPMIDAQAIGLWGASQAGWVIPKIVKKCLISPSVFLYPPPFNGFLKDNTIPDKR